MARTQGRPRRRAEMAAVLATQQRRRGAPPEALVAGERLRDDRTVAILTGQQAGLFGGPLFTLLKALTAISLAERLSREQNVPAVAVFWIDAEDHDWQEVGSCNVLDRDLRPRQIALPQPGGAGEIPVASIRLDESVRAAAIELATALPATEFSPSLIESLSDSYRAGTGMAEAFGRWMERVLGRRGLIVYDSSDPAGKPLAGDIFRREIETVGETTRLAALAGAEMIARGYHAQVVPHDDSLALFQLDGGRRAIRREGDRFLVGDGALGTAELIRDATERPSTFSPNVLLRPIVQDTLFPTVCYVAGPNELGYLGQLRAVYGHFDVPMPLIYPRASATLLDSAAVRFLQKYDLPFETLQAQDEAALNHVLESHLPPAVDRAIQDALTAVNDRMEAVIAAVPALDPTLEGAARSTLAKIQQDFRTFQTKVIHAAKRRDETMRRQFFHARAQAFPDGHPQERSIGFVYFLNKYGPALVDRLAEELPLDLGVHWVITI